MRPSPSLDNNRGQTDVALAGQSIVYELTDALQSLANYAGGSGNISSLARWGCGLKTKPASCPSPRAPSTRPPAAKPRADAIPGIGDRRRISADGHQYHDRHAGSHQRCASQDHELRPGEHYQHEYADHRQGDAVTQLQTNLTQQMAAADTMIYDLQQQTPRCKDMFTAEQDSEIQASGDMNSGEEELEVPGGPSADAGCRRALPRRRRQYSGTIAGRCGKRRPDCRGATPGTGPVWKTTGGGSRRRRGGGCWRGVRMPAPGWRGWLAKHSQFYGDRPQTAPHLGVV
jgi:hypothetical protein